MKGGEVANLKIMGNGKGYPPLINDGFNLSPSNVVIMTQLHLVLVTRVIVEGILPNHNTKALGIGHAPMAHRLKDDSYEVLWTLLVVEVDDVGQPSSRPLIGFLTGNLCNALRSIISVTS
jgi:hypothetical protein